MAGIKVSIDATGAKQGAAAVNQAFDSMADHAVKTVQTMEQVRASLKRQQEAQAQARQSALQEISALQQKIAIQKQVQAGAISVADATRRMAEAQAYAATGSRQLAQQLVATRAEYERNAQAIQKLGQTSQTSTSAINTGFASLRASLVSTAAAFVSLQSAGKFVEIAENVAGLRTQITNLNSVGNQGAQVFARLQGAAKDMGVPLQTAVDVFTRLSFAAGQFGASNADILKVTETLQKMGVVGKVSVENMNSALTQLGQIFTQGKFQADELNIILAQAPQIIQQIAEGMGITVAEMLRLRAEGKLTVEETFRAILTASDKVNEKFEQMPVTVGRASQAASVTIGQAIDELNQKLGITQSLAEGILGLTRRISVALNLETQQEQVQRLKQLLADLRADQAAQAAGGFGGLFATFERGSAEQIAKSIAEVEAEIAKLEAAMKANEAQFASTAQVIKSQYTPEQLKAQEETQKFIERLREQAATLNLSGEALANYVYQQKLAETGNKAMAEQARQATLQLENEKQRKEDISKAEQKRAAAIRENLRLQKEAAREAKQLADKIAADEIKREEFRLDLIQKDNLAKDAAKKANAESLRQLQDEVAALHEEGQIIEASLGTKEDLRNVELAIAHARVERQIATEQLKAKEDGLTQAEADELKIKRDLMHANIEAAAAQDRYAESVENAALKTSDLKTITTGLLSGTQDLGSIFEDVGSTMGVRLVEGIMFGKGQNEQAIIGNFNQLLGVDAAGLFGAQGANLGNTLIDSILGPIVSGGRSLLDSIGIDLGGVFGTSFGTSAGQSAGSTFSNVIAGGSSTAASAGSAFGTIFGGAAAGAAGLALGKGLNKLFGGGGTGSTIGGLVGGIGGAFFGPLGSFLGGLGGSLIGGFIESLFGHTKTKGSQIRKSIKDFLKDIEVSFASEIDSGEYFFEETKRLAEKMFGGSDGKEFLAASKVILNDKIGPELAKQLQALGTVLTSAQAKKLNKNVEQAGTTFGNLLLDNLGLDPDTIDDAIQEIVQKADISFGAMIEQLNDLFTEGDVGVEFYKDAVMGAVEIFNTDLPQAINVSQIALNAFNEAGVFDLEEFEKDLKEVTGMFEVITESFVEVVRNAKPGEDIGQLLGEQIQKGIGELAIDAFLAEFINARLFEGIDLADGLGADELALVQERAREAAAEVQALKEAFGLVEVPDDVADDLDDIQEKAEELYETIRDLTEQRFQLRLDVVGDLQAIGALSNLDAINARLRATGGITNRFAGANLGGFSIEELEQGVEALREARAAQVDYYREIERQAQEQLQSTLQAIQENYDAQRTALRDATDDQIEAVRARTEEAIAGIRAQAEATQEAARAQIEAIEEAAAARIEGLEREKDATRELFEAQLESLQEQLRIAEEFGRVAESIDQALQSMMQSSAQFTGPEQLAALQRQAGELRAQIAQAPVSERAGLMEQLAQVLSQQVSRGGEFLDPTAFMELFNTVAAEMASLRDQAVEQANQAANIQQQIADTTLAMEAALLSIDAQIQATREEAERGREEQEAIIRQSQAAMELAIAEAQAQAEQEIRAIEALFTAKSDELSRLEREEMARAEAATTAELERVREQVAGEITRLAILEDNLLTEQLARAAEQAALSAEQLQVLRNIEAGGIALQGVIVSALERLAANGQTGVNVTVEAPLTVTGDTANNAAVTEEAVIQMMASEIRRDGKIRNAIRGIRG